jgi:sensor histidine kinase YesM
MQKTYKPNYKIKILLFIAALIISILPIFLIPILGNNTTHKNNQPFISNGTLDVKGYNFEGNTGIPLVGTWEFFWNKWLITDKQQNAVADSLIQVPSYWNEYPIKNSYLPSKGYASYRLKVVNWPGNKSLICYIPNIGVAYRVFLNGKLAASRGVLDKDPNAIEVGQHVIKKYPSVSLDKNVDIVIEVDSLKDAGLYLAPVLISADADTSNTNTSSTFAGIYLGVMLVMIAGYGIILIWGGRNFYSVYLLLFVIIMSFKIFMRDEFYGISSIFHLNINIAQMGFISYVVSMLSPIVFLLCLQELLHIKLFKKELLGLALYCTSSFIAIMVINTYKKAWILPAFTLFTLFSILMILRKLVYAIKHEIPFAKSITIAYVLLYGGILVDTFYANGAYIHNMSMYLPLTFCFFLIIMVMIYAKQNAQLQSSAIEAENLRLKIKEAETDLMLSQIKPHFIFNALTAILALIRTDPKKAESVVKSFSKYLRTNMVSIESKAPIPFEQELKHVKTYIELEQIRFQNRINVLFDIGIREFSVPPLTIQPLVENAIRHGICKKKEGGTVLIKTYEENNYIYIEITDDGVGFNTDILQEKNHSLGIKNVNFRLTQINATLTIDSKQGSGTAIYVKIPAGKGDFTI